MSRFHSSKFGSCFSRLAAITLVLQPSLAIASPNTSAHDSTVVNEFRTSSADVELRRGGILVGQVVSDSGAGVANARVELSNGRQTWRTHTNAEGWFQITELRGGMYQFRASGQTQQLRAWSQGTAPPSASRGVLVTPPDDVFRGQRVLSPNTNQFFRVAKRRLANPLVVTGTILTAVAIPVAIHNADDDPPATP